MTAKSEKFPSRKSFLKSQVTFSVFVAFVAVGIVIISFLYAKSDLLDVKCQFASQSQLTYWPISLESSDIRNDNLTFIKRVFDRLGYREINGSNEKWDIMWSIEFPYESSPKKVLGMKSHQSINHIPGMTFLTNKMYLAITTHSKYIPKAFEFPKLKNEYLYYYKTFPKKRFVVKNFNEGGIKIVQHEKMDFFMGNLRFVQELVDNPLLIDGKAFDLGVYVLITSVNPLRIYRYKRDVLLRFCRESYHPFDPENVDKYVVTESYLNSWEIPSLKTSIDSFGFSTLDSFQHYLRTNGRDVENLWEQVDDAIIEITLAKVKSISRYVELYEMSTLGRKRKLFELLRFDFIIDDDMKLHLMEINMSPSLTTTKDNNEKLSVSYEQLIYNTLSIVGATKKTDLKPSSTEELLMLSAPKDIAVSPEDCTLIENSCDDLNLCLPCLSNEETEDLHQAYREHQRRGEMKRIFPTEIYYNEELMDTFSNSTKLSVKWFNIKCEEDYDWC